MCNTTTDRNHADSALEKYVTETVMAIVKGFFSSPFSVNHANLQVFDIYVFPPICSFQELCTETAEHRRLTVTDTATVLPRTLLSSTILVNTSVYDFSNLRQRQSPPSSQCCQVPLLSPQTNQSIFIKLLQSSFRLYNCNWIVSSQKANIESCIKTLADVGECWLGCSVFRCEY